MTAQADLFAMPREPVVLAAGTCGPDYPVEEITVPVPGFRLGHVGIEVAQHTDGRWMWSSSYYLQTCGSTYRVGPKWGKFAPDRLSAIREALAEFDDRVPAALVNELRRMV